MLEAVGKTAIFACLPPARSITWRRTARSPTLSSAPPMAMRAPRAGWRGEVESGEEPFEEGEDKAGRGVSRAGGRRAGGARRPVPERRALPLFKPRCPLDLN